MEFVAALFDDSDFVPRADCGAGWTDALILANNVGQGMIFLAYLLIPVALLLAWRWLRKRPTRLAGFPRWVVFLFAAFILMCGFGHLWDVVVFYRAPYRFFTVWRIATGLVSLAAVYGAWRGSRWLRTEFEAVEGERDEALEKAASAHRNLMNEYERRSRQNGRLQRDFDELRERFLALEHLHGLKTQADELRQILHDIRGHL